MIKKYWLLSVLCFSTGILFGAPTRSDMRNLKAAIENSSVSEVTALLKKKSIMTEENKQELLDLAEEKVAYYEDNMSLWTSKKDTASFVGGLFLSALGLGSTIFGSYEISRKQEALFIGGGFFSMLGISLMMRGYSCVSGKVLLTQSEEVFTLVTKVSRLVGKSA